MGALPWPRQERAQQSPKERLKQRSYQAVALRHQHLIANSSLSWRSDPMQPRTMRLFPMQLHPQQRLHSSLPGKPLQRRQKTVYEYSRCRYRRPQTRRVGSPYRPYPQTYWTPTFVSWQPLPSIHFASGRVLPRCAQVLLSEFLRRTVS